MTDTRPVGRPRKVTREQARILRAWKPLKELARELGIPKSTATWVRFNRHRNPAP